MKLDYLNFDRPIIRLYHFTADEAADLMNAIGSLASGREKIVRVHSIPCVDALDGRRLTLARKPWDQAILKTGDVECECGFTAEHWDNVAGLLEPFAAGSGGFQFLAGSPGEAKLLFSVTGEW